MLPGKMPILKIVPERRACPTRSPRLGNRAGRPRVATPVRCSRETRIQAPCPPPLRRARGPCEQQVQDAGVARMTQTILAPTSHSLPASATAPPATPGGRFRLDAEMEVGGGSLRSTGSNAQRPPQPALPPRTPLRSGPRPALRPRTALPPGPGARPAAACGAVPPPARSPPLTRSAAVRTHLRSRPLPGHPQRRRGRSPLGQRGGRGRRARAAAAALWPDPTPAKLRARGQPSAPGAGPEPAVPARPLALRPAPPRRRSPLSPPPARPGPLQQEAAQALPTGGGAQAPRPAAPLRGRASRREEASAPAGVDGGS